MTARATVTPRLLPAPDAAQYLGVSPTTLRTLPIPRVILGSKRLYDRLSLDSFASSLPVEGEAEEPDTCEGKFGR